MAPIPFLDLPSSSFAIWARYFRRNPDWVADLCWDDPYRLTSEEKEAVAVALQHFQLGEGADGEGYRRRLPEFARRFQDTTYGEAALGFMAEEQSHSGFMGRFMDQQGIPRLQTHWVDALFQRIQRLAGLELCVRMLVTAEVIAIPFFSALHRATRSPVLQEACGQILQDEVEHIRFHAAGIGWFVRDKGTGAVQVWKGLHGCLLLLTAWMVWLLYRRTIRRGGYTRGRFFRACRFGYARMQQWVEAAARTGETVLPPLGDRQSALPGLHEERSLNHPETSAAS